VLVFVGNESAPYDEQHARFKAAFHGINETLDQRQVQTLFRRDFSGNRHYGNQALRVLRNEVAQRKEKQGLLS
jgi:hypothetical protein